MELAAGTRRHPQTGDFSPGDLSGQKLRALRSAGFVVYLDSMFIYDRLLRIGYPG